MVRREGERGGRFGIGVVGGGWDGRAGAGEALTYYCW